MMSQDDFQFIKSMKEGLHRTALGSYEAPLPFKDRPQLPDNRIQAEKRLKGLKRKMDADSTFKTEYNSFIDDLIARGHAEPAISAPKPGEVWYIPHFAVRHPKKKKLRVVFDCSATYAGTSLNDHILQGPDLTNNLIGILLRFRQQPVALSCDVEKMFHNFFVNAEDRDYLRFLWFTDQGTIKEYRMTVHLFGATSSPAVATYCLRELAEACQEESPTAANFIKKNFYVDDGLVSVPNASEAIELVTKARKLCQYGNIRLHKFLSNDKEVLREIPDSERAVKDVDLCSGTLPSQRTLGLEWSVENDLLQFKANVIQQKSITRRGLLSMISQLYDPLGFLSPYTLIGKNLLQQVNKTNVKWDEQLDLNLKELWEKWSSDLNHIEDINIPRCMKPKDFGKVAHSELHHFSDASLNGIGACSYIRLVNEHNQVHTSLLLAKSRVVPSKGVQTIPRLELQGAVMATELSTILRKELDITVTEEHFWTDSEIVLAYLANDQKRFHIYVANRIRLIKTSSDVKQWHHISSIENPADIASRGMSCSKLNMSMWFTGPSFLGTLNLSDKLSTKLVSNVADGDP